MATETLTSSSLVCASLLTWYISESHFALPFLGQMHPATLFLSSWRVISYYSHVSAPEVASTQNICSWKEVSLQITKFTTACISQRKVQDILEMVCVCAQL